MKSSLPVLAVDGLTVGFSAPGGMRQVVGGISYQVEPGRTLGVVGESGCGKSVTALAVMGLVPPPGRVGGSIQVEGREVVGASDPVWRSLRGARVAMVFQEPMTALNPVMTVGQQIAEVMVLHQCLSWREAGDRAVKLLEQVGIQPAPAARGGVSAPALGWDAATGHDRDGARVPPGAADRRRADDGVGCDDPGADFGPDGGPAGRDRHGDAVHQPQPGGGQ